MRVIIAGGKLQGTEAAYLAHKAGWEVILLDKNPFVPASGLCDTFYQINICNELQKLTKILQQADFVIPALEDIDTLQNLKTAALYAGIPIAFDSEAYSISCSKKSSDQLFFENKIPAPAKWPNCKFPVIIKPSRLSGSAGVKKIETAKELMDSFVGHISNKHDWIIQEFLSGPSFSIEIIGHKDEYKTLQVTQLEMDDQYDCKRVLAPAELSQRLKIKFSDIATTISKVLGLTGIMDVEVILYNGELKVLEIDARLPSQTPTTVYISTGINMKHH